jgi:LCP family protein required for cell wall assembly
MKDERNNHSKKHSQYGGIDGFITPRSKQPHVPSQPQTMRQTTAVDGVKSLPNKPAVAQPNPLSQQSQSWINAPQAGATSPLVQSRHKKSQPKRKFWQLWRRSGKKWSWKRRITTTVALIVVVAIGAAAWDAWQLDHKVNHLSVGNLTASVGGAENILVAGSTNRCNLKVQNAQWGFCSQGVTGVNSDVIFIVHIVPKTHSVSILSIPRDTFVPNARSGDEAFKIDAALYQGPTQLVTAIQEDFGIPIQHYAEVGFDGFVNIVNAVGGIKMDFPMPVYDSESYLNIKTPGCQLLNGVEALQVVRSRHLQYKPPTVTTSDVYYWPQEPESDIARIARTHEFLRVLASTVAAKGLSNPITDQKLVDAVAPQVQVDSGLSTSAMLQLLEQFHAVDINNIPQYTLPISTTAFGSYNYGGTNYGDVVFPAEGNDQKIINEFLGVSNTTNTMTGNPLPGKQSINVNVVNGSGTPDQATQTAEALQNLGFNVVGTPGTAAPLSSEAVETVVNYASPRTEADAEAVARQLTGPVILSQNASKVKSGSTVTVVTGTGLAVNAPASSTTTTATKSTAAAATPAATSTATTGLEPASSAMQGLSAWDPRACTN